MKLKIFAVTLTLMVALCSCTNLAVVEFDGEYPAYNAQLEETPDISLSEIVDEAYGEGETLQADTSTTEEDVREMRGVWLSFLEYEWVLKGKTQGQFTDNITEIFARCLELDINTVVVQMRSHGDAYYNSQIYPTSEYASGIYSVALGYDPLEIMVELAHGMGLEIHAWINPFRLTTSDNLEVLSDEYKLKQWYENPQYMQMDESNGMWYLNPANDEVIALISQGVKEIVENYDIDAMHIDDYFYVLSPDKFGHTPEVAKASTSKMVKSIYDTVKTIDSEVEFGLSPAGGYGETPNSDLYYYTDIVLWSTTPGYIDYIVPQIYWEYDHETAPFLETLEKWENLLKGSHAKLYVGLAAYKFSGTEILNQQVETTLNSDVAKGYIHFRYDNIK